jgi:hypothetical protein
MTMIAATLSGLVIPAIMEVGRAGAAHSGLDAETLRRTLQGQANYTVMLNRSAAAVHFSLFAVAMALWSIVWPARTALALSARVLGLVIGLGVIAWALSGTMTLEAQHGALLVTFVQALWILVAAAALMRTKP